MSDYFMDGLEADVIKAAEVLQKERYYEHIDCLFLLIEQAKHYQRITESLLNSSHGARTYEENNAEIERAIDQCDWYRYKGN